MVRGSRSLALEAWGLSPSFHPPGGAFSLFIFLINFLSVVLVFRIRDIGDLPVPAVTAAGALIALVLRGAAFRLR